MNLTVIEYGLIAAGIAVAIIGIAFSFGNNIEAEFAAGFVVAPPVETTIKCWLTDTEIVKFKPAKWSMTQHGTYGTLADGKEFSYSSAVKCYAVDTEKEKLD